MPKPDEAHLLTEKELKALEHRISQVYKQATDEVSATIKAYFESFRKRDEEMRKQVDAGKITEDYYKQWRLAQIGRGKRFEALRDQLAERYTKANETAIAYVNDLTPGIYSLNRNYAAYTIEQVAGDVGFTIWDEQTVKRLIVEQPDAMPYYPPKRAVKRKIDLAYGKSQITKSVTSSILQGSSIGKMADDLQHRIADVSRVSAIRAARTSTTAAQNAGRLDSYHAAQNMGIKMRKEWLATLDGRTRHAHAMLDGQKADVDKPFKVEGNEIRYPGDPLAAPYLVYNCRCTLIAAVYDVDASSAKRRAIDPKTEKSVLIEDMSYTEWARWKTKQKDGTINNIKFSPSSTIEDAKIYAKDILHLDNVDYDKFNIDVANMVNQEIANVYNVFGVLHEKGVLRAIMIYPKKANFYAAYMPGYGVVYMKNVNGKNALTKMRKEAETQRKLGFWSTSSQEHAVRHELGHAVEKSLTDATKRNKIAVLRNQAMKNCGVTNWSMDDSSETMKKAGSLLSYYGLRSDDEFVAESVAEYLNGSPRELAAKVIDILLGRD